MHWGGTMKPLDSILSSTMLRCMLPLAGLIVSQALHAATWQATVGAESDDLGRQGWAFLPNELWIHAGDSVTWTFASDEPHTVSFLTSSPLPPSGWQDLYSEFPDRRQLQAGMLGPSLHERNDPCSQGVSAPSSRSGIL